MTTKVRDIILILSIICLTQVTAYAQKLTKMVGKEQPQDSVGQALAPYLKKTSAPVSFLIPVTNDLIQINLDHGWNEIARQERADGGKIAYAPTVNNAHHEIITATSFLGLQNRINADKFVFLLQKQAIAEKSSTPLDWKVINDTDPNDVLFEYTVKGTANFPNQYEIQRVICGKDALYNFIYHTRMVPCEPKVRSHMIEVLQSIAVLDLKDPNVAKKLSKLSSSAPK